MAQGWGIVVVLSMIAAGCQDATRVDVHQEVGEAFVDRAAGGLIGLDTSFTLTSSDPEGLESPDGIDVDITLEIAPVRLRGAPVQLLFPAETSAGPPRRSSTVRVRGGSPARMSFVLTAPGTEASAQAPCGAVWSFDVQTRFRIRARSDGWRILPPRSGTTVPQSATAVVRCPEAAPPAE